MPSSLLIVDDDPRVRTALQEALESDTVFVQAAESAEAGLAVTARQPVDVVLADVRMPGGSGLDLLRALRARCPDTSVILMTAHEDLPTVAAAMRDGAIDVLVKPLDLFKLRDVLGRLVTDRHSRADPSSRPTEAPGAGPWLVGRDPAMIEVFKLVGHAAATRSTVLVRGESGTGKELIARSIHALSPVSDRPFIAVNCAAVPDTLLESELFGHVRGAFTGATSDRQGRFAAAGDGTVVLDEIGDTSADFQAKLLRVLQDGEFFPVGADRPQQAAARIIAATHQDLEDLIDREEFRRDLYYRLRVIEVRVPPLRARASDIPLLAATFLDRKSALFSRPAPVIADDTMAALLAYDWPGNVRELENCLERALVVATSNVIRPDHLQLAGRRTETPALATLSEAERVHIARVLRATHGHKSRAAEMLGISRPRLDRLIEKYGLAGAIGRHRPDHP